MSADCGCRVAGIMKKVRLFDSQLNSKSSDPESGRGLAGENVCCNVDTVKEDT